MVISSLKGIIANGSNTQFYITDYCFVRRVITLDIEEATLLKEAIDKFLAHADKQSVLSVNRNDT